MDRRLLVAALLLTACAPASGDPGGDRPLLANDPGKSDSARVRLRLTESSPFAGFGIECDGVQGCEGYVDVELRSPDGCAILDDPRCGIGQMDPTEVTLAEVVLRSATEGERRLPLTVATADGEYISSSLSVAFYIGPQEELDIEIERAEGAPDFVVQIGAQWLDATAAPAAELEAYLQTVPEIVSFYETATGYGGYRAYELEFEQPLDHNDPAAGVFTQRVLLHHRDATVPMVLYTSGYQRHEVEWLSELTETLGGNQLEVEQRFFADSTPPMPIATEWAHVTIEQAAADQHRIVEALRPFYTGSWVGTGHSKGGMTSIYHRRFHPSDLDLTVAYVAPISFEVADPRYVPFLDAIGTDDCRERVRAFQRVLLARASEYMPGLQVEAEANGLTYEEYGGFEASMEFAIETFEWSFWQGNGVASCPVIPEPEEVESWDAITLSEHVLSLFGYGLDDASIGDRTYNYQVAAQLGNQRFSVAHLADLSRFDGQPLPLPAGTMPQHDPAAMEDIQRWVNEEGTGLVFIYGEYDPWTGGAFDTAMALDALSVTAPQAHHGAMIADLVAEDQVAVLSVLEQRTGVALTGGVVQPSRAPHPPGLLRER